MLDEQNVSNQTPKSARKKKRKKRWNGLQAQIQQYIRMHKHIYTCVCECVCLRHVYIHIYKNTPIPAVVSSTFLKKHSRKEGIAMIATKQKNASASA